MAFKNYSHHISMTFNKHKPSLYLLMLGFGFLFFGASGCFIPKNPVMVVWETATSPLSLLLNGTIAPETRAEYQIHKVKRLTKEWSDICAKNEIQLNYKFISDNKKAFKIKWVDEDYLIEIIAPFAYAKEEFDALLIEIDSYKAFKKLYTASVRKKESKNIIDIIKFSEQTRNKIFEKELSTSELADIIRQKYVTGEIDISQYKTVSSIAVDVHNTEFEKCLAENTIAGYKSYNKRFPASSHIPTSKGNLLSLSWQKAKLTHTVKSYTVFLKSFPRSKYAKEARKKKFKLEYKHALTKNTVTGYKIFLKKYPKGQHTTVVHEKIFDIYKHANTAEGYLEYIKNYPKHTANHRVSEEKCFNLMVENNNPTLTDIKLFIKQFPLMNNNLIGKCYAYFQNANSGTALIEFANLLPESNQARSIVSSHLRKATGQNTISAYREFIGNFPNYENEVSIAEDRISGIFHRKISITNINTNYSNGGVTVSCIVKNSSNYDVPLNLFTKFNSKTEYDGKGEGNGFFERNQYWAFEGKGFSDLKKIELKSKTNKNISKYFNTTVKGEARGLQWDIFGVGKSMKRRLKINGTPTVTFTLPNEKMSTEGMDIANEYLSKAENSRGSLAGIKSLGDFLGAVGHGIGNLNLYEQGKTMSSMMAKVHYAQMAVNAAPQYKKARTKLALYSFDLAENVNNPGEKFTHYSTAYENACLAISYGNSSLEMKNKRDIAKQRASLYGVVNEFTVEASSKLAQMVIEDKKRKAAMTEDFRVIEKINEIKDCAGKPCYKYKIDCKSGPYGYVEEILGRNYFQADPTDVWRPTHYPTVKKAACELCERHQQLFWERQ